MTATDPATATKATYDGFTADERSAMKQRAAELKSSRRGADTEADVLAKIAEMAPADRATAERLHAVITTHAPELTPKLWYGMPAYARNGTLVCHFQPAAKFKTRYPTLGFSAEAQLDDGDLWPVTYAISAMTPDTEARIAALVQQALS